MLPNGMVVAAPGASGPPEDIDTFVNSVIASPSPAAPPPPPTAALPPASPPPLPPSPEAQSHPLWHNRQPTAAPPTPSSLSPSPEQQQEQEEQQQTAAEGALPAVPPPPASLAFAGAPVPSTLDASESNYIIGGVAVPAAEAANTSLIRMIHPGMPPLRQVASCCGRCPPACVPRGTLSHSPTTSRCWRSELVGEAVVGWGGGLWPATSARPRSVGGGSGSLGLGLGAGSGGMRQLTASWWAGGHAKYIVFFSALALGLGL